MGVVSPIGIGVSAFWKAALAGQSGISAITSFDPFPMDGYRSKVAGQVHDFAVERFIDSVHGERVDRYAQFALVAAKEALADSGLQMEKENPHRVGVIVGAGMGGMVMGEREITQLYQQQKPHRVHPNFIPVITLNSASGIIAMAYGAKGPNLTISTACSSSAHALGQALHCIREGRADVVIAVGADASITPLVFAGFCSLRALSSKFNDHPEKASRPFDRSRDGFIMGEGAGTLILESAAHAKKRKARSCRNRRLCCHQRGLSYGHSTGRWHGSGPYDALALADAGVTPAQVNYINAHATSTTIGDAVEVKAITTLPVASGQNCHQRHQVVDRPPWAQPDP
jgi:3-oxoacyl-[acyl-carrier-protein] synthase II